MLINDSLVLLWAFKERHIENIAIASLQLAQELRQIGVPSNTEWVVPSAENRISWLYVENGFALVAPESRGGDISNNISKVWRQAADLQWEFQFLDRSSRRIVVLC
jgi:hypothetical protein